MKEVFVKDSQNGKREQSKEGIQEKNEKFSKEGEGGISHHLITIILPVVRSTDLKSFI